MEVEHFNSSFPEDKGLIYSGHFNCHKQGEGGGGGGGAGMETTQSTLRRERKSTAEKDWKQKILRMKKIYQK